MAQIGDAIIGEILTNYFSLFSLFSLKCGHRPTALRRLKYSIQYIIHVHRTDGHCAGGPLNHHVLQTDQKEQVLRSQRKQ